MLLKFHCNLFVGRRAVLRLIGARDHREWLTKSSCSASSRNSEWNWMHQMWALTLYVEHPISCCFSKELDRETKRTDVVRQVIGLLLVPKHYYVYIWEYLGINLNFQLAVKTASCELRLIHITCQVLEGINTFKYLDSIINKLVTSEKGDKTSL